jgi:hypothetical protein
MELYFDSPIYLLGVHADNFRTKWAMLFFRYFQFHNMLVSLRCMLLEQFPVVFVEIPKITDTTPDCCQEQRSYAGVGEIVFREVSYKKPVLLHTLYDFC